MKITLTTLTRGQAGQILAVACSILLIGLAVVDLWFAWRRGIIMIGIPPYAMLTVGCFGLASEIRLLRPTAKPTASYTA
jgi:hypothetical protein